LAREKPVVGALYAGPRGGMLRHGGTNLGGPGRPRDEVRQAYLQSYDERREILERIADGDEPDVALTNLGPIAVPPRLDTRIRAVEALGRGAGMGSIPEKPDNTQRVVTWRFEPSS
jgi:hypothetical protein